MKYFIIFLFLLSSCTRTTISQQEVGAKKKDEKVSNPIVYGPTKKSSDPFEDHTDKWGLKNQKALRLYAVDWDADGDTDLITLDGYFDSPKFFRFDSKRKLFVPVLTSPLKDELKASFLAFVDFNRDDLLDMVAVTLNQKTELTPQSIKIYKGVKKDNIVTFKIIEGLPFKPMPTSSLGIVDLNLDGYLDLYIGNWFSFKLKDKISSFPDKIYYGGGNGFEFSDHSVLLGDIQNKKNEIYPNALPTFGVSTCDMDQNGFSDILTASSSRFRNRLWLNLSQGSNPQKRRFLEQGEKSGVAFDDERTFGKNHGGNSYYLNCADYNNDGIMDLALGELFYAFDEESQDRSSILTGSTLDFPPKFLRTEYHKDDGSGRWGQGDRRAIWKDLNGDGLLDLLIENSGIPPYSRLIYFEQQDDHSFIDRAEELGINILNPSGVITLDVDQDGVQDIITGQTNLRNHQIKNRIYAFKNYRKKNSLRILLRGKFANRRGIGSTLILKTNRGIYRRYYSAIEGALPSQNEEGLHFHLGYDENPLELTIRWPYLVKNKNNRPHPLTVRYNLNKRVNKLPLVMTACDDGRLFQKRNTCR